MEFDQYQEEVMRTAASLSGDLGLSVAALGLNEEAGEFAGVLKKHLGQGHTFDREKMIKELGDVLWYAGLAAEMLGVRLSEVAARNVEKLRARYPNGFEPARSLNRRPGDD